MWNFATSVLEKIVGFSPIKTIFQHLFQKFSNDFLQKQPLFTFREGMIELDQLQLSSTKINQTYLVGSPYVLSEGKINSIKIRLPSSQIKTAKSVEVKIRGIELIMEPNQNFKNTFQMSIKQIRDEGTIPSQENLPSNNKGHSLNFFKRMLQEFLTNIEVEIENVSIRWFMNARKKQKSSKEPQHFLMLRIPRIMFQRMNDMQLGKISQDFLKYKTEIPQISIHIMKENLVVPEYHNIEAANEDIPYNYPPIRHPNTIFLIGRQCEQGKEKVSIVLRISKDVKNKIKQFSILVDIPNVELMIQPRQLIILSKYIQQIKAFKAAYTSTIQRVKKQYCCSRPIEESRNFQLNNNGIETERSPLKISMQPSNTVDLFSSFAFQLQNIGVKQQKQPSYLESIFEGNIQMQEELHKIEEEALKEMRTQIQIQEENTSMFKKITIFKLSLDTVRVYVVKYQTSSDFFEYERVWSLNQQNKQAGINVYIKSDYILFMANHLTVCNQSSGAAVVDIKLRSVDVLDVKLKIQTKDSVVQDQMQNKTLKMSESVDIFQSFQSIPIQKQMKQLITWHVSNDNSHYCSTSILSISAKHESSTKSGKSNRHCDLLGPLCVIQDSKSMQQAINVKIQKQDRTKITVVINQLFLVIDGRFVQDLVMIAYPLLNFKAMVSESDLKSSSGRQGTKKIKILNQSIYDFNSQLPEPHGLKRKSTSGNSSQYKKSVKNEYILQVQEVHVLLRGVDNIKNDLVETYKNKTYDYELFDSQCYCDSQSDGIHLRVTSLVLKRHTCFRAQLNQLTLGYVDHMKTNVEQMIQICREGKLLPRVLMQTVSRQNISKREIVSIHIPKFGVTISESLPKRLLKFGDGMKIKSYQIQELSQYLKQQINRLCGLDHTSQNKQTPVLSAGKVAKIVNIHVQKLGLQFLTYELLVKNVVVKCDQYVTARFFEGILFQSNQPRLKLQNPWKEQQYSYYNDKPQQERFSRYGLKHGIDRIVAFLEKSEEVPQQGQLKDKQYFDILFKLPSPICVNINATKEQPKQQLTKKLNNIQPDFHKTKNAESSPKYIDIVVNSPVTIKLCELRDFKHIKMYIDQIKNMVNSSQLLKPNKNRRKSSQDLKQQPAPNIIDEKIILKVNADVIHLDVFPYVKSNSVEEVVSHTRSMILVEGLQINFNQKQSRNRGTKIQKFKAKWKQMSQYFVTFSDCHAELNKEVITFSQIQYYGFKRILDLKGQVQFTETKTIQFGKQFEISATILQLDSTISSKSIYAIIEHLKHIISTFKLALNKLNLSQQHNNQQKQVCSDSQSSAQDFQEIEKNMTMLQQKRQKQQSQFISQPIQPVQRQNTTNIVRVLNVRQLDIRRVCIKVTDKSDYDFFNYIPRGDNMPLMIQLDEKLDIFEDLLIQKHDVNIHKRYRTTDKKDGPILKLLVENANLQLDKYIDKLNTQDLNTCILASINTIKCQLFLPKEESFPVIKTIDRLEVLVDVQNNKIRVKTSGKRLELGFTSSINFIKKDLEQAKRKKKILSFQKLQEQQENREDMAKSRPLQLMLYLPEMTTSLHLKLIGCKLLKDQPLQIPSFFFHNVLSKYMQEDNKNYLKNWIKVILTDNLGGIIGNGFTNIVSNSLVGLLSCAKQLVLLPGHAIRIFTS